MPLKFFALTARRILVLTAGLMLFGASPRVGAAIQATNDVCSGAIIIPGAGVPGPQPFPVILPTVDITRATNALSESASGLTNLLCSAEPGNVSRGVWYKFRPVSSALYTITTLTPATTVDDTVLAVYTSASGCAGPFVRVVCNDDISLDLDILESEVTVQLLADTDYYILVWKYDTDPPAVGRTDLQLIVDKHIPPPNDTCNTAVEVYVNTPARGSTVLATNNYQLANTNAFWGIGQQRTTNSRGRDVVFKFTAPETDQYSFRVSGYRDVAGYDLLLYAAGYCAPGSGPMSLTNCIAASTRNSASSVEEIMCAPLEGGQLVYIYVDDTNFNGGSSFTLEVTRCLLESEPNGINDTTASKLASGIEGAITNASHADYFALGAFPPGSRLFAMVDGSAARLTDFNLRATTQFTSPELAGDTLEFDDNDNDFRFGANSPNLSGTMLPGGPAYLKVNAGQALEPYRLYAVVQPPLSAAAPDVESGPTLLNTNESPASYYYGTLSGPAPSADQDLFRVVASDGDLLFISLDCDPTSEPNSAINAQLELLDDFGNTLILVNDPRSVSDLSRVGTTNRTDAGNPDRPGEALAYRCMEGVYYVRVSIGTTNAGTSGAGDYLLSIAKNCIPGATGYNTTPVLNSVAIPASADEGAMVTLNGTYFDPDLNDSGTLVINWGDGSSDVQNIATPGINAFSLSHQYPADANANVASQSFSIGITITDSMGAEAAATTNVVVGNRAPAALVLAPDQLSLSEGQNLTLDGSFTDPGALDAHTITIDWGDNTAPTVLLPAVGTRVFSSSHLYLDDNPTATPADLYTITVTVGDDDLASGSTNMQIMVGNVAPALQNVVVTSPVYVGSNAVLSATISDPSSLDGFLLTVNWGDGSPSQNFNHLAGTTVFSHAHAYAAGNTNFDISLLLQDDDGGIALGGASVQVKVAPPAARFVGISETVEGHVLLQLQGTPLVGYRILTSSNLTTWSPLGQATADGTGAFSYVDTLPPPGTRFYRAESIP